VTRLRSDWRWRWLRGSSENLIYCKIKPRKGLSSCAGERGRKENRRESTGLSVPGEIRRRCLRGWRSSGGWFDGLAVMHEREKGRAERGDPGSKMSGLDGQLVRSDGAGVTSVVSKQREKERGRWRRRCWQAGQGGQWLEGEREGPDRRGSVSVRKEGSALPFWSDPGMGRGLDSRLGRKASSRPFLIFSFLFFLFFFLFSYFFCIFCKKCFKSI
jgi:hypothetical protein